LTTLFVLFLGQQNTFNTGIPKQIAALIEKISSFLPQNNNTSTITNLTNLKEGRYGSCKYLLLDFSSIINVRILAVHFEYEKQYGRRSLMLLRLDRGHCLLLAGILGAVVHPLQQQNHLHVGGLREEIHGHAPGGPKRCSAHSVGRRSAQTVQRQWLKW